MYDLINPTAPRWTLGPRRRPANFQRVGGNARESYISASDHHGDMHGSCELETEVLEMADGPNGVDLAASKGCRFRSGPGLQRLRIAAEEKQPTGQCTPTRLERGTRCEFVQCGRGCSSAHRPEATAWLSRPLFLKMMSTPKITPGNHTVILNRPTAERPQPWWAMARCTGSWEPT